MKAKIKFLILGIIVIFAGFSYKNTIMSATMFMDRIDGMKIIKSDILNDVEKPQNNFPFDINFEGIYRVEVSNNKIIKESNNTTNEIRKYVIKLSEKSSKDGYIGDYI